MLAASKDYLSNPKIQSLLVIMIIVLLLGVVKSIFTSCACCRFIEEEPMQEAVYTLFREIVILVLGAIIVHALNYYGVL